MSLGRNFTRNLRLYVAEKWWDHAVYRRGGQSDKNHAKLVHTHERHDNEL